MNDGDQIPPDSEPPNSEDTPDESEIVEGSAEEPQGVFFRTESFYRGDLPPPAWLREYNEIVPGCARQMIDDVHAQSAHRREIERDESRASIRNAGRGQWMGFIVGMTGILGGLGLAFTQVSLGGGVGVALVGLAVLAAVYVTGTWKSVQDAAQMAQADSSPATQELPRGEGDQEKSS